MTSIKNITLNILFSSSLFLFSFFLAWQVSANTNFLYSMWYEVLELDQAISKYAPDNKYKHGFENTDKQQHIALFSGIVKAIQQEGDGLEQLRYNDTKLNKTESLLTEAEVLHLQDVANLVKKFKYAGIFGIVLSVLMLIVMRMVGSAIGAFKKHILGGIGIVALLFGLVLMMGPTKIFYVAHELVFPKNHQWFFYYEESLMSTMMKAPVLFGPIAGQLLLLTMLFWLLALYVLQKFQPKFKRA